VRAPGEDIVGWMQNEELHWLAREAREMASVIEVGCWAGRSTAALLSTCPGFVIAIDHFQGSPEHQESMWAGFDPYTAFLRNHSGQKNLRLFPMSSRDASHSPLIPPCVDFVFIDGEHSRLSVCEDLVLWAPRARGLVAGHDFSYPGVNAAVKFFFLREKVEKGPGDIWFVRRGGGSQCQSSSEKVEEEASQPL